MKTIENKSQNLDILCNLEIPVAYVWEKDDVWSPYAQLAGLWGNRLV